MLQPPCTPWSSRSNFAFQQLGAFSPSRFSNSIRSVKIQPTSHEHVSIMSRTQERAFSSFDFHPLTSRCSSSRLVALCTQTHARPIATSSSSPGSHAVNSSLALNQPPQRQYTSTSCSRDAATDEAECSSARSALEPHGPARGSRPHPRNN